MPEENGRLTSWKQIAAYLERSERTVRRWHETEGLPVHKHQHLQRGSVWAYVGEIEAWRNQRRVGPLAADDPAEESSAPARVQPVASHGGVRPAARVLVLVALTLTVVGAGVLWFLPEWVSPKSRMPRKPVSLTALPGREFAPAFSPDGKQVAFFWTGEGAIFGGGMGIFLKTVGSEEVTRLVMEQGGFPYSPAWSPDGKTIAFVSRTIAKETWLCLVAASGGPEKRLIRLHNSEVLSAENQHLAWSLDSQKILAPLQTEGRQWALHWIPVAGGTPQRITPPADSTKAPAASPDRRSILYLQEFRDDSGSGQAVLLQELKPDGSADGTPRQLRRGPGFIAGIAWLPNGREFVMCQAESGYKATHLYRAAAAPNAKLTLLGVEDCSSVAVSSIDAEGAVRIAYGRMREANIQLWKAPLSDLGHGARFAPSSRTDSYPNFSPDGQRLSFYSKRSGEPAVWIVNQDGTQPRRLSDVPPLEGQIEWSPDGSQVLFGAAQVGLAIVPLTGGAPSIVATSETLPSWPHWSHGNGLVYFLSAYRLFQIQPNGRGRTELKERARPPFTSVPAIVPLTGGAPSIVATSETLPSWPHWSHGNGMVYFLSAYRLFQIQPNGSGRTELTERARPPFTSVPAIRTSPDGKTLFLTRQLSLFRRAAHASEGAEELIESGLLLPSIATTRTALYYLRKEDKALYALPFAGGSPRKIGTVTPMFDERNGWPSQFTISPDDRTIVWSVGGSGEFDLELITGFR